MGVLLLLLLASCALAQEVCFYEHPNYVGTKLCGREGDRIDVYRSHRNLNDKFSSVRVPVGLQVLAYADDGFHGASLTYQADTSSLGGFGDVISSFIVQPATACFYTGKAYTGTTYCASVHDIVDLPMMGSTFNNNFESVKIAPGLLVKVYCDAGLMGRFTWFSTDTPDLGDFNNHITSLIVEFDNQVCFFTDPNYTGEKRCARPGEAHDVYQEFRSQNDKYSSVRVPNDLFVQVYADDGYHGASRMYTEDETFLNGFGDTISSFVVGFSGVACFYTDIYWRGSKFCLPYGDSIDLTRQFNSFNDKFRSVIIPEDLQVKSYEHGSYQGRLVSYQSSTRNFGSFSNLISAINVTAARTVLYDNVSPADKTTLEMADPRNLTICLFVNDQGAWKVQRDNHCRTLTKQYACNNVFSPNLWRLSSASGTPSGGLSVCQSEFGDDYTYGTPRDSHSNSLLSNLAPAEGMWINLYYDAFSNEFSHRRVRRSTDCGGANQRACTYADSRLDSWICSLPVISLFACRDPYCNDGLTRTHMYNNFYNCKCPTNMRVKRGINNGDVCEQSNAKKKALTGEELVKRLLTKGSTSRTMLESSWTSSRIGQDLFQERGGWIFANPLEPSSLQVILAPKSASGTFRSSGTVNPAIDLEGAASANAHSGWTIVGNFHTHPLDVNQQPSLADVRNAFSRGVPGIVISRGQIYVYGPLCREDLTPSGNHRDYPNDGDDDDFNPQAGGNIRAVRQNPFRVHDEL